MRHRVTDLLIQLLREGIMPVPVIRLRGSVVLGTAAFALCTVAARDQTAFKFWNFGRAVNTTKQC